MDKSKLTLIIFAATLLTFIVPDAFAQTLRKIEGQVSDKDDHKIPGVLVRAYRGAVKIGEDRTKADGSYVITFDNANYITTIRYDHSDWNPTVIRDMSGMRNNTLNKVLNRVGEPMSPDEQRELSVTLQRLYMIDRANGASDTQFTHIYGETITRAKLPSEMLTWLPPARGTGGGTELASGEIPLSGIWEGKGVIPGIFPRETNLKLYLMRSGDSITGEVQTAQDSFKIRRGEVQNGRIMLYLDSPQGQMILAGRIQNNRIEGEWDFGFSQLKGNWSVVKTR